MTPGVVYGGFTECVLLVSDQVSGTPRGDHPGKYSVEFLTSREELRGELIVIRRRPI